MGIAADNPSAPSGAAPFTRGSLFQPRHPTARLTPSAAYPHKQGAVFNCPGTSNLFHRRNRGDAQEGNTSWVLFGSFSQRERTITSSEQPHPCSRQLSALSIHLPQRRVSASAEAAKGLSGRPLETFGFLRIGEKEQSPLPSSRNHAANRKPQSCYFAAQCAPPELLPLTSSRHTPTARGGKTPSRLQAPPLFFPIPFSFHNCKQFVTKVDTGGDLITIGSDGNCVCFHTYPEVFVCVSFGW